MTRFVKLTRYNSFAGAAVSVWVNPDRVLSFSKAAAGAGAATYIDLGGEGHLIVIEPPETVAAIFASED